MRHLLLSLLLASCTTPLVLGAMKVSSSLAESAAPHQFAHMNSEPLWSSEVRPVDPRRQAYERLPAIHAVDTMVAESKQPQRVNVALNMPIGGGQNTVPQQVANEESVARVHEWCGARYRSYDATDNSYQPYGGGARKPCSAPAEVIVAEVEQTAAISIASEIGDHARWCLERYSSYRVEDNSYQPFSGGRKQCLPPQVQSASNAVESQTTASTASF